MQQRNESQGHKALRIMCLNPLLFLLDVFPIHSILTSFQDLILLDFNMSTW